jgi:hypothetical protein
MDFLNGSPPWNFPSRRHRSSTGKQLQSGSWLFEVPLQCRNSEPTLTFTGQLFLRQNYVALSKPLSNFPIERLVASPCKLEFASKPPPILQAGLLNLRARRAAQCFMHAGTGLCPPAQIQSR